MSDTMRDAFEAWWEEDGQFCRAGGGDYEKTFAFHAWQAAQSQPAPPAQPSDAAWKLVPVEPTPEMLKAVKWDEDAFGGKSAWPSDIYKAMLEAAPAPPVPASVQEIMRLMMPYVAACAQFDEAAFSDMERAEAVVAAAFKPLRAAITALVDENHRLKFELDGVNAMRGPLSDDKLIDLMPEEIPPKYDVQLLQFARAIEKAHGIEPEQGESHE